MALKQNIIYIYFKGKHQVTSKSQYQYNRGQYLYFADLNLPQAFEVHFSNKDKGESKTQIGSDNLVEIPDEYFWNGALQIYAWIYLHSKTTDGETIYEVRIPLTKRAKPTDEEPLPVQQSTIDRAIAELNNAVDITTENANKTDSDKIIVSNIKEDVIILKENIDSTATIINQKAQETIDASGRAETSAQNAAISENKALDYSQQAEQSAQSALESKNIAQQKSEVATNASNEALDYRDEALEAKNQAVQAKQNIVDYRDETKGYRDETLNLKNNVQTLKNQIDETAEEIEDISDSVKEDAQSASRSASSASQSSTNASQSASQAKKSADDAEESANQAKQNKNQTETFKNQSEEYKIQTETFKNQAEEFKNQTETNVTHYPKIIGEYWYIWDATNGEYINTNVDANGIKGDTGNGIASVALNDDYTLTITFTDDTTYTTSSIRGQQGEKGDTGATGESGVYIGTEEPENEDIKVWIDTDDDGTSEDLVKNIESLKRNIYKPYAVDSVSGSIASFSDGADDIPLKSLVVDIDPVQNLNGYDSPWVGGGGKNLITSTEYRGSVYNNDVGGNLKLLSPRITYTQSGNVITITNSGSFFEGQVFATAMLPSGQYAVHYESDSADFRATIYIASEDFIVEQKILNTGGVATVSRVVTLDADARIVVGLCNVKAGSIQATNLQVESGSAYTSWSPYENICPINGWTGCEVGASGKNLLDEAKLNEAQLIDCFLQNAGKPQRRKGIAIYLPSGTYSFTCWKKSVASAYLYYNVVKNDGAFVRFGYLTTGTDYASVHITLLDDEHILFFDQQASEESTQTKFANYNLQLELGSTATAYEPYKGQTIPISWQTEAGTVYGGKLDVLSGKLTVTFVESSALDTLNWSYYASEKYFYAVIARRFKNSESGIGMWDRYKYFGNNRGTYLQDNMPDMCFGFTTGSASKYIYVKDSRFDNAADFKASLAGSQFICTMSEDNWVEIQLTPHEVNSLLGTNNIFADTGDAEVEYRADTKLYIDKKIVEALASLT